MKHRSAGLQAVSFLTMLFLYGPIIVLVLYSFNAAHLSMTWRGASLKWYVALLHDEALFAATANSLLIALVSTNGATGLGGLLALGMERMSPRRQQTLKGSPELRPENPEGRTPEAQILQTGTDRRTAPDTRRKTLRKNEMKNPNSGK